MKRFAIMAALAAAFLLSACVTTGTTTTVDPAAAAAKLVTQVKKACAVVQPTILSLQAQTAILTADQIADLDTASALADKVCTAAASADSTVEVASVSDFLTAAFPVVIKVVNAAPIDTASKTTASAALTVAQIALSAVLAQ